MLYKKSQGASEVFKYLMVAVISAAILIGGYKAIKMIGSKSCQAELVKFESDITSIGSGLRYGERELNRLEVPCETEKIYILDLKKGLSPSSFGSMPIIKNSLESRAGLNVFLVSGAKVTHSFYSENIQIDSPGYFCLRPMAGSVSIFAEGAGTPRLTVPPAQIQC